MPTDANDDLTPSGLGCRPFGRTVLLVLALATGPMVGLGLSRFAYALLLPPMQLDLRWTYSVAATLNTANAAGYLAGALLATPLARRYGSRRIFVVGMVAVTVGLFATSATSDLPVLLCLRAVGGIGGAVSFVAGAGLVARAGAGYRRRPATALLAIYFAGSGVGIVASGLVIPPILSAHVADAGWRLGWLALGCMALAATVGTFPRIRWAMEPVIGHRRAERWPARRLGPLLAAYFLYGLGYIAYTTFIIAFITAEGARPAQISAFWIILGLSSVFATFLWTRVLGRSGRARGPALVLLFVAVGAAMPLLSSSVWAVLLSAIIFGGSFLSVVTAVTVVARATLEPRHWTPAIGALTVSFAVGQCLGPVVTGLISDGPEGLSAGLAVSAAILALAALCALGQRHRTLPNRDREQPQDHSSPESSR